MRKAILMLVSILTIAGISTSAFAWTGGRPIAPPTVTEIVVTDQEVQ